MIILENINKSFNNKIIIKDFSHTFEGFIAIMGASGCGKTTLVRIMAGLLQPDSGQVNFDGKLSFMFQEDRLLLKETALTNLLFVNNDKNKAMELLKKVQLDELSKKAEKMSGGMRRRVALCRALMPEFDAIILDEPFKGLDKDTKRVAIDIIKKQCKNKIVICVTHDKKEVDDLGAKLLEMK